MRLVSSAGRRRALAPLVALVITLLMATAVSAGDPAQTDDGWFTLPVVVERGATAGDPASSGFFGWQQPSTTPTQPADHCTDVRFAEVPASEVGLVKTDADLISEGNGSRLCIFFNTRWDSYEAWVLDAHTLDEFRAVKRQLQPLLGRIDLDSCRVAFWSSLDERVRREITLNDRMDAGKPCEPQVIDHGARSAGRREEVRQSVAASATTAEQTFGWSLTWPLRVHLYDNQDDFVGGFRREGGEEDIDARALQGVRGATGVLANGQFGYLINIGSFPEMMDLRMLVAHEYAHVAQAGLLGDPDMLPFFAVEGGAEYFASLVVGPEQRDLAGRFREASGDERTDNAVPLRDIVEQPSSRDARRVAASYSRGYAAMRLLASRWGIASFTQLHRENINGSPSQFLERLARLTGLSLDAFDAELRTYLLAEAAKPAVVGRATYPASSRLIEIATGRLVESGRVEEVERFSRSDSAVVVVFAFECLSSPVRGEVRLIAPGGRPFTSFGGASGPGCDEGAGVQLELDRMYPGGSARSLLGTWTAEIYTDGTLQGTITFVVE